MDNENINDQDDSTEVVQASDVIHPAVRARRRTLNQLNRIKQQTLNAKPYTPDEVQKIKTRVEQAVMDAKQMESLPLYNGEMVARLVATILQGTRSPNTKEQRYE